MATGTIPPQPQPAFTEDGWFQTGDLGVQDASGQYAIRGRSKELIISGGVNIHPREIEECIESHPSVVEAAAFGEPDPDFGEIVCAAIVTAPGVHLTREEIVEHCRAELASFKKPRRVTFLDALPRNALGKLARHRLRTH